MQMSLGIVALWILSFLVGWGDAEVFSSYAHVERMIDPVGPTVKSLENVIRAEEQRLVQMKNALDVMKRHLVAASADREAQLNNPINVYFLMKTVASDWSTLKALISVDKGRDVIAEIESTTPLPDREDVDGAAMALFRLQDTYKLSVAQISSGTLSNTYKSPQFTARECFDLGIIAHNQSDAYHTVMWMQEAMSRWEMEDDTQKSVNRVDIMEYLSSSMYKQGNSVHALAIARQMLEIDAGHRVGRENSIHLQQVVEKEHPEALKDGRIVVGEMRNERPVEPGKVERDAYERLCDGHGVMNDPVRTSKLRCYYLTQNNPRLLLSPAKVEEAFDRPLLLLFHDILLDSEMELIKTLARPKLTRATVINEMSLKKEKWTLRVSKHTWLYAPEHPSILVMNQRFEDYTGLDFTTAEPIQVANYGLGGFYVPHFDYLTDGALKAAGQLAPGNRIATLLIYITDVDAGGATVFTNVGARIVPRKGTAVFWYNLHRNGTSNSDTRHAACPVLLGNKWAVNKWFREHGQELRRPCSLDPSE